MTVAKTQTYSNTWDGVLSAAKDAQARYPELVAAQWALESGWGKHVSGEHNYFGLKGPGTTTETQEFVNGEFVSVKDSFLNFESLYGCVDYLVTRWYKNWKRHKGVNNAANRESAARQLVKEGYATDPAYADKLIKIMNDKVVDPEYADRLLNILVDGLNEKTNDAVSTGDPMRITALKATALKKSTHQVAELKDDEVVQVDAGKHYEITELNELAADSHAVVKLAHGAGTWYIWLPHWHITSPGNASATPELDWNSFNALITPNLTVGEVLQWDKRRTPSAGSSDRARIVKTAREFQRVRDAWGRPLGVTSFYRPEPINRQVGGVQNSRHVSGEAFDVYPVGASIDAFYQWIRTRWTGGLGDGRNKGFIHLDTRANGHFVPGSGVRPYTEWLY